MGVGTIWKTSHTWYTKGNEETLIVFTLPLDGARGRRDRDGI